MKNKNLIYFIIFIILTFLAICFVKYKDNQIAENYDKNKIIQTRARYIDEIEEDGKLKHIIEFSLGNRTLINVNKNDTNNHQQGDVVFVYTMGPNYNYYSYSTIELVKHETNMIRYYPLFLIPGICTLIFGIKLIKLTKNDDNEEYYQESL